MPTIRKMSPRGANINPTISVAASENLGLLWLFMRILLFTDITT
jgi:hypothetical protein